jgi:hypothetical protein
MIKFLRRPTVNAERRSLVQRLARAA